MSSIPISLSTKYQSGRWDDSGRAGSPGSSRTGGSQAGSMSATASNSRPLSNARYDVAADACGTVAVPRAGVLWPTAGREPQQRTRHSQIAAGLPGRISWDTIVR